MEPQGPVQTCSGKDLPLPLPTNEEQQHVKFSVVPLYGDSKSVLYIFCIWFES
jgi:hypothetical protein